MLEYVTGDDSLAAIVFADHDAVNFLGGAIAAVEAETIQEMNNGSTLNDAAVDSFRAVADGIGTTLNGRVHARGPARRGPSAAGDLSDEIKQLWRKPQGKRAYRLSVDDYGAGTVILYLG